MVVAAATVAACGIGSRRADPAHPSELTGRWVRLRPDSTWGDTMEFRSDGTMGGSVGYPVPPGLRWVVKPNEPGGPQFCASVGSDGFCRPYHLRNDELEMIGGPQVRTLFRRVR
jgi:hypothetical protein